MKNFSINRSKLLQLIVALIFISLPLTGSDCEKILVNNGPVPAEMVGNWKLIEQTGALQDICPDENANFQSNGVAQLTCPNESPINRDFKVENNVLTYTQTSVAYNMEFINSDQNLVLYGQNVSRNLKYEKIAADVSLKPGKERSGSHNSSESGGVQK